MDFEFWGNTVQRVFAKVPVSVLFWGFLLVLVGLLLFVFKKMNDTKGD